MYKKQEHFHFLDFLKCASDSIANCTTNTRHQSTRVKAKLIDSVVCKWFLIVYCTITDLIIGTSQFNGGTH